MMPTRAIKPMIASMSNPCEVLNEVYNTAQAIGDSHSRPLLLLEASICVYTEMSLFT